MNDNRKSGDFFRRDPGYSEKQCLVVGLFNTTVQDGRLDIDMTLVTMRSADYVRDNVFPGKGVTVQNEREGSALRVSLTQEAARNFKNRLDAGEVTISSAGMRASSFQGKPCKSPTDAVTRAFDFMGDRFGSKPS